MRLRPPFEAARWDKYRPVLLDMWALAFARRARDLPSTGQWEAWDGYLAEIFSAGAEGMVRGQWETISYGQDPVIRSHAGSTLQDRLPESIGSGCQQGTTLQSVGPLVGSSRRSPSGSRRRPGGCRAVRRRSTQMDEAAHARASL